VTVFSLCELVNGGLLTPNVEGAPPDVDRFAANRSGAEPAVRLRCQLRLAPRAWLHRTGEPLYRRLRGVPGDPRELGSLGPPVSRGAAHRRHVQDANTPGGARQWPDVLGVGLAQGVCNIP
jgi:hypothetical protein